jgi:5-formyltetrahydrofolate cyclo-ligase
LQRRNLPLAQRRLAEHKAARSLLNLPLLRKARHVAIYVSVASELSTRPLIAALAARKHCRLYAPAVHHDGRMSFLPLLQLKPLRRDALDLPRSTSSRGCRSPHKLDAVILPMVGFDAMAHRLGAGGGFYDRSFAFRRQRRGPPVLIGVAFEAQRAESIPCDDWDLRLDLIVTERRIYRPAAVAR